jgi:hypothetical protein
LSSKLSLSSTISVASKLNFRKLPNFPYLVAPQLHKQTSNTKKTTHGTAAQTIKTLLFHIELLLNCHLNIFFSFLIFQFPIRFLFCASNLYFSPFSAAGANNINMSYNKNRCSSAICRKNSIRCHLSWCARVSPPHPPARFHFALIFGAIFIFSLFWILSRKSGRKIMFNNFQ